MYSIRSDALVVYAHYSGFIKELLHDTAGTDTYTYIYYLCFTTINKFKIPVQMIYQQPFGSLNAGGPACQILDIQQGI